MVIIKSFLLIFSYMNTLLVVKRKICTGSSAFDSTGSVTCCNITVFALFYKTFSCKTKCKAKHYKCVAMMKAKLNTGWVLKLNLRFFKLSLNFILHSLLWSNTFSRYFIDGLLSFFLSNKPIFATTLLFAFINSDILDFNLYNQVAGSNMVFN